MATWGRRGRRLLGAGLYLILGSLIGRYGYQLVTRFGPDPAPQIETVILSESMRPYVRLWKAETARRYENAVIVFVHGDDFMGTWAALPDLVVDGEVKHLTPRPVALVVSDVRAKYPSRRIVLVTCNPGHYGLPFPNVSYSVESVWLVPDQFMSAPAARLRELFSDGAVGDVYGFEEN